MNPLVPSPPALTGAYRLQFHRDFTLRDALALVPYLQALGVSHLYASPLLQPMPGSAHGYDTADYSRLNAELGTEADLEKLCHALRERDMALLLDIVPNHMGVGAENPWWWSVLEQGAASPFARCFDIEWDHPDPELRGKVLVPVLGDAPAAVLAANQFRVTVQGERLVLTYFEHRFPLTLARVVGQASCLSSGAGELKTSPDRRDACPTTEAAALAARLNAHPDELAALIEQQHYRLAHWRDGDRRLNYRRFFNVSTLAGLRVEDAAVFDAVHERIRDWYERGWLGGLRVDHIDGLRDPARYLPQLRALTPQCWLLVEKILAPDELLPGEWPVAGTTGYEFLNRVTGLLLDPEGEAPLTDFYREYTGITAGYADVLRDAKRLAVRELLAAETDRLTRCALAAATGTTLAQPKADALRDALVELITAFSVYRTYLEAGRGASASGTTDRLDQALTSARGERADLAKELEFLAGLFRLRHAHEAAGDFTLRFQQLTGPAMAKGAEDTAFYRYNRLLALNEVGGEPDRRGGDALVAAEWRRRPAAGGSHEVWRGEESGDEASQPLTGDGASPLRQGQSSASFGYSPAEIHATCIETQRRHPFTLLTTSTHDTKRSEDVRARLCVLSERPAAWRDAVLRWTELNQRHRTGQWPDRDTEYFVYQTLVGAWPIAFDRLWSAVLKSVREARQQTSWPAPDAEFETALQRFLAGVLADATFIGELSAFVAEVEEFARINSLAQTLFKLTAPGVPDIYQGNELWDFSLVDPDNRRPVDFALRQRLLAELPGLSAAAVWARRGEGLPKLFVIQRTLQFRRQHPGSFGPQADYIPLSATGSKKQHAFAYRRGAGVIVVMPRLSARLGGDLVETALELPPGTWRNVFTDATLPGGAVRLAGLFAEFPVALLQQIQETMAKPRSSGRESAQTSPKMERTHVRCYSFERGSS